MGYDHKAIVYEIHSTSLETVPEPTSQKHNWAKANWKDFQDHLVKTADTYKKESDELIMHSSKTNPEAAAEKLTELIQYTAE